MIRLSLAALALVLTGCVFPEEPTGSTRAPKEAAPAAGLEITLVRKATVEIATKTVAAHPVKRQVDALSRSKFGAPGEIADLGCVLDGLRAQSPAVEIVPTASFWEEVAAPDGAMSLLRLFRTDKALRLKALDIDFLITAYHQRFDVKSGGGEMVIVGGYTDEDREVAAAAVIDPSAGTVLNAVQFVYEREMVVSHAAIIVPVVWGTYASSDPCTMIGEASADVIAQAADNRAPRVLVVAAKDNPYVALGMQGEGRELLALYDCADSPETCEGVDLDRLYTRAHRKGSVEGWPLYCLAAHFGHSKARMTLANYYRRGMAPVAKDLVQAALWYGLAERDGLSWAGTNRQGVEKQMTPAQRAEATRLTAQWAPSPSACRLAS